jgi:hypothetical protein
MPLQEVLAVLVKAEQQLNEDAMKGWFQARANPEGFKAYRRGVEAMRLRAVALLTGGQ